MKKRLMAAEAKLHPSRMGAVRFSDGTIVTASRSEIEHYYTSYEEWLACMLIYHWMNCWNEIP
jgi:hypothetical protein